MIDLRSDSFSTDTSFFTVLICSVPTKVSPRRMAHTWPSATNDAGPADANALRPGRYSVTVRLPSILSGTSPGGTDCGAINALVVPPEPQADVTTDTVAINATTLNHRYARIATIACQPPTGLIEFKT